VTLVSEKNAIVSTVDRGNVVQENQYVGCRLNKDNYAAVPRICIDLAMLPAYHTHDVIRQHIIVYAHLSGNAVPLCKPSNKRWLTVYKMRP